MFECSIITYSSTLKSYLFKRQLLSQRAFPLIRMLLMAFGMRASDVGQMSDTIGIM